MLSGKKANILIVDDSKMNVSKLNNILMDKYDVDFALSGESALKTISHKLPDLILLDIIMPGMSGYEVCKILKSSDRPKYIPIIFVTSRDYEFDEAKAFEYGAVDYIVKPVREIVVNARVKAHLSYYYHQIELEDRVHMKTKEIYDTRLEIIKKLGIAAEYKDNDTGMHIARMSRYCYIIAKNYGLSEADARTLLNASPMHDVGKIGIPDNILEKKGMLDEDEWLIMRDHCRIGKEILGNNSSELLKIASIVSFEHHEKWDGSGYPRGLKNTEIKICARIVALCDVFDALTSNRPYKKAWPVDKAIEYIRAESGKHFDPKVVEAFDKSLDDIIKIKKRYTNSKHSIY